MPSTTVPGGSPIPGGSPLVFNSSDAQAAGTNVSNAISSLLSSGAASLATVDGSLSQQVFNTTSPSVADFTALPGASSIVLGSEVLAVVDSTSGGLHLAGGAQGFSLVSQGDLTFTNITASGTATDSIVAGGGSNYISTADAGLGFYNVQTGSGDDTVGLFSGNGTVNAGTGHNTIVIGGGATGGSGIVFSEGYDSIVGSTVAGGQLGSGGTDTIDIGSGTTTINPGSSNFVIYGNDGGPVWLQQGGSGSDTVQVGAGGGTVYGGSGGHNYLIGGATTVPGATTELHGAAAGDQLYATGSGNVLLAGGAGNETISAAGGVSPVDGTTLGASSGNDTLVAGTGADSLVGGIGADTFRFINGQAGGSDTITGFSASDTVSLNGYSYADANAVLSNAVSVGGNTLLTLTDGTTITFAGTSSLNASQVQFNK